MLLIFDGPEKAGKSTLINQLTDVLKQNNYEVRDRHWGKVENDSEYASPVMTDLRTAHDAEKVYIWDRSWASEEVYARLLGRQKRARFLPRYCEWLYGRAVSHYGGMKYMLAPDIHKSISKRDDTDLPVDPWTEFTEFEVYANTNEWYPLVNRFTRRSLDRNVTDIMSHVNRYKHWCSGKPIWQAHERFWGNKLSRVLFVDDVENRNESLLTLPFSHVDGWRFSMHLGNPESYQWTTLGAMSNDLNYDVVVAFGESFHYIENNFKVNKLVDGYKLTDYFTARGEADYNLFRRIQSAIN